MLKTPVALILFRRPEHTKRVLAAIAQARPRKLFVVADGPRPDHPEDAERCAAARAVVESVDWDCEVLKNYSDVNLGCGRRPATGLDWVFEQAEEAIILEDDCVPELSFFQFCEELMDVYRDDERVMHINGSTYQQKPADVPHSYFFSRFPGCWGWATWRRAWKHFDFAVKQWPRFRDTGWMDGFLGNEQAALHWGAMFQGAYEARPNLSYWDYQWLFACWANSGLAIVPRENLVSNVGCGDEATHTGGHPLGSVPVRPVAFPLVHPPTVLEDWNMDRQFLRDVILPLMGEKPATPLARIRQALSRTLPERIKQALRRMDKRG